MSPSYLTENAGHLTHHGELYFRTYLHTVFPLHAAIVKAMCKAASVPLELASVLEDIGQGFCRLSDEVNTELRTRDQLRNEPDSDDTAEARIDEVIDQMISDLDRIVFFDGQVINTREAVEAHPVALDALRTALLLAKAAQSQLSSSLQGRQQDVKGSSHGMLRRSGDR